MSASVYEAALNHMMATGVPFATAKSVSTDVVQATGPYRSIIDFTATLPASPSAGDSYIMTAGQFADTIAMFAADGTWHYSTPYIGDVVFIQALNTYYSFFTGGWISLPFVFSGWFGMSPSLSDNSTELQAFLNAAAGKKGYIAPGHFNVLNGSEIQDLSNIEGAGDGITIIDGRGITTAPNAVVYAEGDGPTVVNVTNISVTNPAVVTLDAPCGLANGSTVIITGVRGATTSLVNAVRLVITASGPTATSFTIPIDGAALGWTSGGQYGVNMLGFMASNVTILDTQIPFSAAQSIAQDDVLCIWNPTESSYLLIAGRENYHDGEFVTVSSYVDGAIATIYNTNPCLVVTNGASGIVSGKIVNVVISGVVGDPALQTAINGVALKATYVTANSFTLNINATSLGAYTSGGAYHYANIVGGLFSSYNTADVAVYKLAHKKISISNLTILAPEGTSVSCPAFRAEYIKNSEFENFTCRGSLDKAASLQKSLGISITNCHFEQLSNVGGSFGTGYGLSMGNCQSVQITGGTGIARTHCFTTGGNNDTCSIVNRFITGSNVQAYSHSGSAGSFAFDFHGNTEHSGWSNCSAQGGFRLSGNHTYWDGGTIRAYENRNTQTGVGFSLNECCGADIRVSDLTIECRSSSADNGMAVNCVSNTCFGPGMRFGGTLVLKNITYKAYNAGSHWPVIQIEQGGSTQDINIDASGRIESDDTSSLGIQIECLHGKNFNNVTLDFSQSNANFAVSNVNTLKINGATINCNTNHAPGIVVRGAPDVMTLSNLNIYNAQQNAINISTNILIDTVSSASPTVVVTKGSHKLTAGQSVTVTGTSTLVTITGISNNSTGVATTAKAHGLSNGDTFKITGANVDAVSNAAAAVIETSSPHGLVTGNTAVITIFTGAPDLVAAVSGSHVATVISPTRFSIAVNTLAMGPYVSGGSVMGGMTGIDGVTFTAQGVTTNTVQLYIGATPYDTTGLGIWQAGGSFTGSNIPGLTGVSLSATLIDEITFSLAVDTSTASPYASGAQIAPTTAGSVVNLNNIYFEQWGLQVAGSGTNEGVRVSHMETVNMIGCRAGPATASGVGVAYSIQNASLVTRRSCFGTSTIASSVAAIDTDYPNTVSATKGDAAATLTWGTSEFVSVWSTAITADRACNLSATSVVPGARFRVVRTAAATGAFNLNVGTGPLAALTAGQFVDVEYNGNTSAWMSIGRGTV